MGAPPALGCRAPPRTEAPAAGLCRTCWAWVLQSTKRADEWRNGESRVWRAHPGEEDGRRGGVDGVRQEVAELVAVGDEGGGVASVQCA